MLDHVAYARKKKAKRDAARARDIAAPMLAALRSRAVRGMLLAAYYDSQERKRVERQAQLNQDKLAAYIAQFIALDGPALIRRVKQLDALTGVGVEYRKGKERRELAERLSRLFDSRPRSVMQNNVHIDAQRYVRSPTKFIARSTDDKLQQRFEDRRADRLSMSAGVLDDQGNVRAMTWAEERQWIAEITALPVHARGSLIVSWVRTYAPPTVLQMLRWYRLLLEKIASGRFERELSALEYAYRMHRKSLLGDTYARRGKAAEEQTAAAVEVGDDPAILWVAFRGDYVCVYDRKEDFVAHYTTLERAIELFGERLRLDRKVFAALIIQLALAIPDEHGVVGVKGWDLRHLVKFMSRS